MWNFTRQLWLAVLAALLASVSVDADGARSLLPLSDCSAGTAGDIAPTSFRVAYTPGGPPPLECFQVVTDAPCDPAGDRCCLSAAGAPIKAPKFKWFVVEAPSQACLTPQAMKLVKWTVAGHTPRKGKLAGTSLRVPLQQLPTFGGTVCVDLSAAVATGCASMAELCGNSTSCAVALGTQPFRKAKGAPRQPCCAKEATTIACSGGLVLCNNTCVPPDCGAGKFFSPDTGKCEWCGAFDSKCEACDAENGCTKCSMFWVPVDRGCGCPPHWFEDFKVKPGCFKCTEYYHYLCDECNRDDGCTACLNGLVPEAGSCVCPGGSYFDDADNRCYPCTEYGPHCVGCNDVQCMACDGNFEPVDDGCVCPPDHYLNATDNCLPCTGFDPQCSKCDLPNNCTACNGGMMPDGTGGCSCPPKYFWDDLHSSPPECVSCSMFADQLCDECDVHGCTSCLNNLVLDSAGFCGCPDSGTYFDDFNGACVNCTMYEAHCASCDEFGCLDCGAGGMIPDGVLGCACPAGTYLKPATDTCSPCTDFGPACTVCGADGGCTACSGGLTPDGQGGCK